ncbi:MAG TPA: hypothetical protein GXX19_05820 [Syntrophomonadaceae bacterium]|nr:hypothetical protein [Syntrophomonadaceae bacterium]
MREDDGYLILYEMTTGAIVAGHKISPEKGILIRNNNHLRDNCQKINDLQEKVLKMLGSTNRAEAFLKAIRREKSRYVRDKFKLLADVARKYPPTIVEQAINYCLELKLYSAVEFRNAANYFLSRTEEAPETSDLERPGNINGQQPFFQTVDNRVEIAVRGNQAIQEFPFLELKGNGFCHFSDSAEKSNFLITLL